MLKTAIVTGGSRGIGAAIASEFARLGYNVLINYKSSEKQASALASSLRSYNSEIFTFKADVSKSDEVRSMTDFALEKFGRIDVLVNNAGVSYIDTINYLDESKSNEIFETNLIGAYNCCKEISRVMINQKRGKIINITSMWGETGASCEVAYSSSKAGVIGLTKSLAKELAPSGITVNAVSPGLIATQMNNSFSAEDLNYFIEEIPLGRIGTTEDIAYAVSFLASDKADYITGQVLSVNGGYVI